MLSHPVRSVHAILAGFALVQPLAASDLTVDGGLITEVILGEAVEIGITGTPGGIPVLLADLHPGPTFIFGQFLPIGFSPALQVFPQAALPASGSTAFDITIPALPILANREIYMLAVVLDSGAPFGLDFSNGALVTTTDPPDAGAAQGTLVGRTVVLNGAAAAAGDGTTRPGYSVLWSLVDTPVASLAQIEDPTEPFATLTPDVPGDYSVHLEVFTPGGGPYASDTTVHAWRVATAPGDGAIMLQQSFDLSGAIEGPEHTLTLDGQAMTVDAGGDFGPTPMHITATEVGQVLRFRMAHADGSTANYHMSLFQGNSRPFEDPSSFALSARLDQSGLDKVGDLGEVELEAFDLRSVLLALPPQQVANDVGPFGFVIFSSTIDFTDLTYNPDMDMALTAEASSIRADVAMYDIRADFDVWGEVLEIPYTLSGYITTSPTTISTDMVATAQSGALNVSLNNINVNRANFDFELTGFVGTIAEAFVIESAVKEQVEATIASEIQNQLGPAMEEILNAFVLEGNLGELIGVDVNMGAAITSVVNDTSGVTLRLAGTAAIGSSEPGVPQVTDYRSTPSPAPVFGSTTPGGQPFEAALSITDDFVNQVLAACTGAGLLDGDLSSLFPDDGGGVPLFLTTEDVATLFPDAGFEYFAEGTPVRLQAHGTVPPVLSLAGPSSGMGAVRLDNLEVEFEVDTIYGTLPLLRVVLAGIAEANIELAADSTLELSLTDSTLDLGVLRTFPGTDPVAVDAQVQFLNGLFDVALPGLLETIGAFPLPSLEASGLSIQPIEASLIGVGGPQLGLFGTLQFVPVGG